MRTFASIRDRPTWIAAWPSSGWRGVHASDASAKLKSIGFDISEDGTGHYLLVCFSTDGAYGADTWHETLTDAHESAERQFWIRHDEWGPARED